MDEKTAAHKYWPQLAHGQKFILWYRLDAYIYDYLQKRKLARSAEAFMMEANVSADPVGKVTARWWDSRVVVAICQGGTLIRPSLLYVPQVSPFSEFWA